MTAAEIAGIASAAEAARPWPGLDAFSEALTPFFCGRASEIEELFRRVRRDLATLFFGQSGLGKTSLLQAGLFPRLRQTGFLPILIRLDHAPDAPPPEAQIGAAIGRAIATAGLAGEVPIAREETLWGWLHRADRRLLDAAGREITPVLAFDQFEEIFTQGLVGDRRAASQSFLGTLAELIENRPPAAMEQAVEADPEVVERYVFDRQDYRIVLTLREDFLASLETLRSRAPALGRNRFRLRRMAGAQALDAILNPAPGLVPVDVAHEIVRYIGTTSAEDTLGAGAEEGFEVEPALLSLVCSELNERRLARGLDRIGADLLAGSRDDIIADFYEHGLADQPEALRVFVEDRLLSDAGFRESLTLDGARRALRDDGVPPEALDALIRRRLLRVEERLAVTRIEIIHDVLTPVIRRSRDTRRLRQAEARASERETALRRERRRVRFWYGTAVVMGVLLLVCVGLAGWAWHSSQEAERSRQRAEQNLALANRTAMALFFHLDQSLATAGVPFKTSTELVGHAINLVNQLWSGGRKAREQQAGGVGGTINPLFASPDAKGVLSMATQTRALFQQLLKSDPGDAQWRYDLASTDAALGNALAARGRLAEALAALRESVSLTRALTGKDPGNVLLQGDLLLRDGFMGDVLRMQGHFNKALAAFHDARAIAMALVGKDPGNDFLQTELRLALDKAADTEIDLGHPGKAVATDEEAVAAARRLYAAAPTAAAKSPLAKTLGNLSFVLLFDHRPQEALARAQEAHALAPSLLWIETNRAHALLFLGRFAEAKAIYLADRDKPASDGTSRTFGAVVEADFARFRKHGINIPAMKQIEALLAAR